MQCEKYRFSNPFPSSIQDMVILAHLSTLYSDLVRLSTSTLLTFLTSSPGPQYQSLPCHTCVKALQIVK